MHTEGIAQKSDGPNVPRSRSIHSASEAEARDELARSVVAKFTSQILEGKRGWRGLVEARMGIGCRCGEREKEQADV